MNSGSPALRVAGIGLLWGEEYAISYARKLTELGFCAKRYEVGEGYFLVIYSYRPFTGREAVDALDDLMSE